MEIAIQGHSFKGKEVIQILENLGGKNTEGLEGTYGTFYYIDDKNEIGDDHKKNFPPTYKLYTLEEFEKEFPFKIGDEVTIAGLPDFPKVITQMMWYCDEILYSFEGLNNTWFGAKALKKFEMKEGRNITLTLEKAKEWYKKGGELKEIALQAFTKEELNPLPRSLEEFYKQGNPVASWRYNIPIKYDALFKLEQLRNCWWNGWKPEWNASHKYTIKNLQGKLTILGCSNVTAFLVFPTRKMAEEFFKCFRDLIEKAGDLI